MRDEDHIDAHFLTCFIALTIIRLLQKITSKKYTTASIIDCVRKIICSNEDENLYLFDYRSEISDAIGDALGIDFTRKRLRLGEIKKILGDKKNKLFHYNFLILQEADNPLVARVLAIFILFCCKSQDFIENYSD